MDFRSSLTSEVAVAELETQREQIEVLRSRLDLLAGRDRALLALYLESGSSLSQMARLTGLQVSSIGRRVRRIIERLCDETYIVCLDHSRQFSALELAIIKDHFVRGLSLRRISANRNVAYYSVRMAAAKARRLAARHDCGLKKGTREGTDHDEL